MNTIFCFIDFKNLKKKINEHRHVSHLMMMMMMMMMMMKRCSTYTHTGRLIGMATKTQLTKKGVRNAD